MNHATNSNTAGSSRLTVSGGVGGTGNLVLNNDAQLPTESPSSGPSVNNAGTLTNSGTGNGGTSISAIIGGSVTGVYENSTSSALTLSAANTFSYNGTTNQGLNILAGTVTA